MVIYYSILRRFLRSKNFGFLVYLFNRKPIERDHVLQSCGLISVIHLMVSFSLNSLGWLLVCVSVNGGMIFLGRIIHGIGEGLGVAVSVIYLGELIDEKYRGGAIATVTSSCQLGIALAYISGVAFTWIGQAHQPPPARDRIQHMVPT